MHVAIFVLIAVLFLVIVSGVYVFIVACVRSKEVSWLDPESLKGTGYEKYNSLIHNSHEWLLDHGAKDIYIKSHDGLMLHGLWVPAENAKGTIIFAHGYKSTMLVDFGKVLDIYNNLGMNLLLPEQRAHGKSEGKIITFGVKESRDMIDWIHYHNEKLGSYQIILSGLSMGASTMMYLADQYLPANVRGLIVDCGFSSPADILSVVFKRVTHIPAIPFIWATDLCARIVGGFSLYDRNSLKILSQNRLPIIMVHGKQDDFVPCYMTEKAFEVCSGNKKLLLVDDAGHGLSFLYAQKEYTNIVLEFLQKNIEGF